MTLYTFIKVGAFLLEAMAAEFCQTTVLLKKISIPLLQKFNLTPVFMHFRTLFSQDLHKELEEKISRFHKREDAILYACCFDANTGLFEVLLGPDDAVLSDELNHASIIDGIRLCKAKKFKYKNKDVAGIVW